MESVSTLNQHRKYGKAPDLTGKTFGELTVLERFPSRGGRACWKCRCSCGNTVVVTGRDLRGGYRTHCGCKKILASRRLNITGKRFGKLTAICQIDKKTSSGSLYWKCRCDCGRETEVPVSELNNGNTKSCGCLKEESQRQVYERLHLIDGTCVEWLGGRKGRSDNKSGYRGVFRKKSGRYVANIGFKKKIYYIGIFEDYDDAVKARIAAEKQVHDGFLKAHKTWETMAESDPKWAATHPFSFEVCKEEGKLIIHNSMEQFMNDGGYMEETDNSRRLARA